MRKAFHTLICLLAMMSAGAGLRAQEVTIVIEPGWNWISYPNAESMPLVEALSGFVPSQGDQVKSKYTTSTYTGGRWRGGVSYFEPGKGYHYYSTRTEDVELVFAHASSNAVATATPTDITAVSAVVGGMVMLPEGSHVFLRGVCWGTMPSPDIDGDHTTEETGIGSFSSTLEGLNPNTIYYVRAYAVTDHGLAYGNEESFTTENEGGGDDHAYVDLGLPSGTLWATCNIGANVPEEYGDYFAWGETQPKDTYNWNNYQYYNGTFWYDYYEYEPFGGEEEYPLLTKYCGNPIFGYNGFTDNLTTLLPEDDAATANWGSDWRVPIKEEWQELYNNTTMTWTTQNGVNGFLFTGSNGNSLFLPEGSYWSSSINTNYPVDYPCSAWDFYCLHPYYYLDYHDRSYGQSVRAVRSGSYTINISASPSDGGSVSGDGTYEWGQQCTLTATANAGFTFAFWTENGTVVSTYAVYSFTVNGNRTLVANFIVSGSNELTYVDLGLPSGTLWATCNIGANAPEESGDYFAWGETQPKDVYDWSTYQYCNGSYSTLTKYCTSPSDGYEGYTDNLTTLLLEDDAATANWGRGWCMPTADQWSELYQNTTHTWVTRNGVNGRLFIASNGSSLFLPAAGYRGNSSLYYADSDGYYWSSTLNTDYPNFACYFKFLSGSYYVSNLNRDLGFSVRAVRSGSYTISITARPSDGGSVSGDGTYEQGQNCTVTATANSGYVFTNWTENGEVVSTDATYTFVVVGNRNLVAKFDHVYVDLGLPSGTLWATCNIGANAPENYGDYFAWGETQPKDVYDWSTYQYCNGSYNTLTKYCNKSSYGYNGFTDSLTTLLPEDDAATAIWGSSWCMPTADQWRELYRNTTHTWVTQNGVNGQLFTAENGSSLFLPTVGGRWNDDLHDDGNDGYYWSSTLSTGYPRYAWYFDLDSVSTYRSNRYNGFAVRPVRSAHDYVDLGLPSGLLWATCNVGANSPEEYGDYFAWGETQPKEVYGWSTYQYSNGSYLTKYCSDSGYGYNGFTDDLTTLLPEDDAATANWGSAWRMPTEAEWEELYNNTTVTWTTRNGVNGRLFTAENGNRLFLPAAGYRSSGDLLDDGSWVNDLFEAGSSGDYWSSTLYTDPDLALGFYFYSYCYNMFVAFRTDGFSVRPVRSSRQN